MNKPTAPPTHSAVPEDLLARAKADAAQRSGKNEQDVHVVSAEPVTWRDASLGCPKPGMMNAQVLTPGYRIRLKVGDQSFDYHAGRSGSFVLCPADRAQAPLPAGGDI